jgi:hypothetical protein
MRRDFHLGDVLSITDGRLVSPTGMSSVQGLCQFMAGSPIFTHSLIRVAPLCEAALLKQHSWLSSPEMTADLGVLTDLLATPDIDAERAVVSWLGKMVASWGEMVSVESIEIPAVDPVAELVDRLGEDRVIVVETD